MGGTVGTGGTEDGGSVDSLRLELVNNVYRDAPSSSKGSDLATKKQPPHPSGRVVSVRLDDDLVERLDALCARTGRSRGLYLKLAVRATLPTLERLHWEHQAAEFEDKVIDRQFHALMAQLGIDGEGTPPPVGNPRLDGDLPLW